MFVWRSDLNYYLQAQIKQRKKAESEREQLVEQLRVAKQAAEEPRIQSIFLASMSHEIRTLSRPDWTNRNAAGTRGPRIKSMTHLAVAHDPPIVVVLDR